MSAMTAEHAVTIWVVDDLPVRMFWAGRRWRVSDRPTRLEGEARVGPSAAGGGPGGWRFQATDDDGRSLVFDVFRGDEDWHVHHVYD